MHADGTLASAIFNIAIVESIPVVRPMAHNFMSDQAREFSRIVTLLRKKGMYNLIVDLSGCEFISSEGLGIISSCWQWCLQKGKGYMSVVLPREAENEVVNLFDITGLSRSIGSALQRNVKDAITCLKTFSPVRLRRHKS